jgi:hypothetical protein
MLLSSMISLRLYHPWNPPTGWIAGHAIIRLWSAGPSGDLLPERGVALHVLTKSALVLRDYGFTIVYAR